MNTHEYANEIIFMRDQWLKELVNVYPFWYKKYTNDGLNGESVN